MKQNKEKSTGARCLGMEPGEKSSKVKIYLASSYKNHEALKELAIYLRAMDFQVYLFSEAHPDPLIIPSTWDCKDSLDDPEVIKRFNRNQDEIINCDILLAYMPAGNSTHMEIGYAKGIGKPVIIYGQLELGKYDAMYGFADLIYKKHELDLLLQSLISFKKACEREGHLTSRHSKTL